MGLFDTVRCWYPLPHHQDAEFQTKDVGGLTHGRWGIGGTMEEYEITEDGRLRRLVHERQWAEDPTACLGGYLRSVRDWWEDVPGAHGDVCIYTDDPSPAGRPWVEFRVRFTNGRVQAVTAVEDAKTGPTGTQDADTARAGFAVESDDRPEVVALLQALKAARSELRGLLSECRGHWVGEDAVYRFYHRSFKVYGLQGTTRKIVHALQSVRPATGLDPAFLQIVAEGTGKTFEMSHNQRWLVEARPILEAFFHARYFLEMAVQYGGCLSKPPSIMPSGWAALLCLYRLR